jgi:hypothetical protein
MRAARYSGGHSGFRVGKLGPERPKPHSRLRTPKLESLWAWPMGPAAFSLEHFATRRRRGTIFCAQRLGFS